MQMCGFFLLKAFATFSSKQLFRTYAQTVYFLKGLLNPLDEPLIYTLKNHTYLVTEKTSFRPIEKMLVDGGYGLSSR